MEFLNLILSFIEITYGSALYNDTLTLQNSILKFVISYHLEKDLARLEKFESLSVS